MAHRSAPAWIAFLQYCTVALMWVFSAAITLWVLQLASVAYALKDAFTASVGITMIAVPVYWALAAILTYTFFGLRRAGRTPSATTPPGSHRPAVEHGPGPEGLPGSVDLRRPLV